MRATACLLAAVTVVGCRSNDLDDASTVERVVPKTVSLMEGWRLFDRSIAQGFDGRGTVEVGFGETRTIAALKVFGATPAELELRARSGGSLGFDTIDLRGLSSGWNLIASNVPVTTDGMILEFRAEQDAQLPVPEIEIWAVASTGDGFSATSSASSSVTDVSVASVASDQIAPGNCATFTVALAHAPSQMRRAFLTMETSGAFRPFSLQRSINGGSVQGGHWLAGDASERTTTEQIDPVSLSAGINEVRLCVPEDANATVTVSNLRIVAELDRGARLARHAKVGDVPADALVDHDARTQITVAAHTPVELAFDRLIAPDAIRLAGTLVGVRSVHCVDVENKRAELALTALPSSQSTAVQLSGGKASCAGLVIELAADASIEDIDVVGSGAGERVDWPSLVVSSAAEHFGDIAWVSGFVARPQRMSGAVRIDVGGQPSSSLDGTFGVPLARAGADEASWTVDVTARLPDGSTRQQQLSLQRVAKDKAAMGASSDQTASPRSGADAMYGRPGEVAEVRVPTGAPSKVAVGSRVRLDIPAGAVSTPTTITAKHLRDIDLPPLDPDMVNVTAPRGHGYEFLPHGQRFTRSIDVSLPFDRKLLPEGKTVDDIKTYYFDTVAEKWKPLERKSIDIAQDITKSATDHFTIMINAVLAAPKNPSPLSLDPTAMSSIGAASPAAGIDLMSPPSASAMGDAQTALPIKLPGGRGRFSPSLSLVYSSGSGNSWLGVGWDLPFSKLEIDTRWGTPRFTSDDDRYVLDGAALVPTTETDGPLCEDGQPGRRYRTRIEGSFAHILRCNAVAGGAPGYHWEVVDRDGTLHVYGDGASTASHASLANYRDPTQVFRWYLARVVDVNGNTTRFEYAVVDDLTTAEPSRDLYPSKIEYTSHASGPAPAYSVELVRDSGTRVDRLVSGRAGFKMVTRHLLRTIRVKFGTQVIRDYVLSYSPGQFGKTTLASVREYGAGGCAAGSNAFVLPSCGSAEFREHRFEYLRDVEGFAPMQTAGVDAPFAVAALPLGAGAASSTTGGLFVKAGLSQSASVTLGGSITTGSRDEIDGTYDLDGDGRPDQVYMDGPTVKALYNQASIGAIPSILFAPRTAPIVNLTAMAHENRFSGSISLSGELGPASAGASYASSATKSGRFLVDVNGDGFIDYLRAGEALLGQPFAGGMRFDPTPYRANTAIDPTRDPVLAGFNSDLASQLVQGDPVTTWIAPFSGHVVVRGTARKLHAGGTDGAVIELYHQDQLQQQQLFAPSDTALKDFPVLEGIDVVAGEALYVRLKTGLDVPTGPDGALLDAVEARMFVTYDHVCDPVCRDVSNPFEAREPTGDPVLAFDSQSDFRVAGHPAYAIATSDGVLALHAMLSKTASAADLRVCVQRFPRATPSFTPSLDAPCDATGTDATNLTGTFQLPAAQVVSQPLDVSFPVSLGDVVVVRVESDFSFDPAPSKLSLTTSLPGQPALGFTTVCFPDDMGANVCSSDPAEIADVVFPLSGFGPSVYLAPPPTNPLIAAADNTLVFDPVTLGDDFVFAIRSDLRGLIHQLDCRGSSCGSVTPPAISVSADESISFEMVGGNGIAQITGQYFTGGTFAARLHRRDATSPAPAPTPFVGGYRRWKATIWNEAEPFLPATLLADYAAISLLPAAERERVSRTAIQPVVAFPPDAAAQAPSWAGPASSAFVSGMNLHASYLGVVMTGGGEDGGGLFTGGYSRFSGTKSIDVSVGIGIAKNVFQATLGANVDLNAGASWTKTTTDVIDLNGDGIVDVLSGDDTFFGRIGAGQSAPARVTGFETGDGFRQRTSRDYGLGFNGGVSAPIVNAKGRPISLNSKDRGSGFGFSSGTGWAFGRSQTTQDLEDVNGDGLPDVLRRSGTTVYVRYNLGSRFAAEEVLDQIRGGMLADIDAFEDLEESTSITDSTSDALSHDTTITTHSTKKIDLLVYSYTRNSRQTTQRTTRQIADLNGDGLPDVLFKHSGQPILVQYNLGGAFADPVAWTTPDWGGVEIAPALDTPLTILGLTGADVLAGTGSIKSSSRRHSVTIPIPGTPISIGGEYAKSHEVDNYELALVDLDGDGAPEHVLRRQTVSGEPTIYVKRNLATGRANLLAKVTNPLGGSFALDYARSQNTVDLPQSRIVLARVEVDDNVDLGPGFESPNVVTTMSYADGFYHRCEKEFFGFGTVVTTRADGGTVTDVFENRTYPLHGRLLSETRRDYAGRMFQQRALTHAVLPVLGASETPLVADPACLSALHALLGPDACVPVFPVVSREDITRAEGGALAKTHRTTDLSRDRFGNVLTSFDDGDDVIATDDVYAEATYQNDTARWILGRPTSLTVRQGGSTGALLRARTGTYDGNGQPITLTVDTGSGFATTQLGYDGYGNLIQLTTPPNESGQSQTFKVTFEPITRALPATVVDGFGLSSTASYDLRFGIATLEVDTNGAQRRQTLDGFGRVTEVFGPYDTSLPGLVMSYFPAEAKPRAVTTTRASAPADYTGPLPAPITTVTITDGIGAAIESRKTAVVGGVPGMSTSGFVKRNVLGQTTATYYPFFTPGASAAFAPPVATQMTTTIYDVMDRPLFVTYPDGAIEIASYAIAASPSDGTMFQTRATDANGHARETYADMLGRTRSFVEHPTATTSSITGYDYLATGELSKIVDAEANVTQLAYDLRGLRVSMTNPDTGLITDRFDLMGNQVAHTEPNHRAVGTEVKYRFDRDRLVTIDYPSKPDVTFTYGGALAPSFRAGRIAQVADETGTQEHFYGAMGEVRRTLRTVTDLAKPSQAPKLFDFQFTTDSLGKQLRVQYPDGERVTNTYDAGGMLSSVVGAGAGWTKTYADQIQYDVFGNKTRLRYGNGVLSTWSYDPQRVRLASIVTTLPSSTKVQDLRYAYDPVGNPRSIQNVLPPPPSNGKLPGPTSGTFTYDGVDRLTHAVGNGTLPGSKTTTYDLLFAYSPSHNVTQKTLQHVVSSNGGSVQTPNTTNYASGYTYGGRPHLPSRVGDNDLTYDASGNLIRREKLGTGSVQVYVWDDDGRMVQANVQSSNQRNVFDASGVRVIREGIDGITTFASALYEVGNNNTAQKHVFVGDSRVATVFKPYTSTATPSQPTAPGTAYFVHGDHLGSSGAVTKDDGTLNDALDYFPSGEVWIQSGPKDPVNGYLFNGKPVDPDTGFYDFGQRFYDPRMSLWLGVDPAMAVADNAIGRPMQLSVIAYAAQSPERYIDPDGEDPSEIYYGTGWGCFGQSCGEQYGKSQGRLAMIQGAKNMLNVGVDAAQFVSGFLPVGRAGSAGVWIANEVVDALQGEEFDPENLSRPGPKLGPTNEAQPRKLKSAARLGRLGESIGVVRKNGLDYEYGNGANPKLLTPGEKRRIQNAANKIGKPIALVGSRTTGPNPESDWDYVIVGDNNGKVRHKVANSLPGAEEYPRGLGGGRNLEFLGSKKNNGLTPGKPYILFYPAPKVDQ